MAKAYFNIPLAPEPAAFGITLAGKEYRFTFRWFSSPGHVDTGDTLFGSWVLDIEEAEGAEPLIMGIPLVAGCDLLEQYACLEFGGELWVDGDTPPGLENIGTEVELVFITEESS
jgi:hypothetical protein